MTALQLPLTSLLSGVALLVLGTGLMFSVIGVQAGAAAYPTVVTGLIMSAYFGGFVYGTWACPAIVRRVGHIRAFAAMASVASTMPILHALWQNPVFWGLLRFVTGVCLVGLLLVVESWLSVAAQRHQRGKVFAAYMAVGGVSMALGQMLILLGDRYGFVPFALASILFSFALLPVTLTPVAQPQAAETPRLGLRALFDVSPIGTVGAVASGLLTGAFYSLGHVFGQRVGMSETGAAAFMAVTILGGAAFQWPVGHLSDRNDRRWVLLWVSLGGTATALAGYYLAFRSEVALVVLGALYGGLSFTIYGLCVAHVNDLVDHARMLHVTGALLLLHGLGATAGPTLAGALMGALGPGSLMVFFAAVLLLTALTSWRYIRLRPLNRGEPGQKADYVLMRESSPMVLQLDPRGGDPAGPGSP